MRLSSTNDPRNLTATRNCASSHLTVRHLNRLIIKHSQEPGLFKFDDIRLWGRRERLTGVGSSRYVNSRQPLIELQCYTSLFIFFRDFKSMRHLSSYPWQ